MDLICFTHINWNFVYQRPQHLLTRFAYYYRVFVIEEPVYNGPENFYEFAHQQENNIWLVTLHISKDTPAAEISNTLKALVDSLILSMNIKQYFLWYYTPMALPYSDHLKPEITIYDCMDELSAFNFAPPGIKEFEAKLLRRADLVFTGGHSLYEIKKHLHHNVHPFPSSIDKKHFMMARKPQKDPADQFNIPYPRIGFYGVLDERLDISLLENMATLRPDWHFVMIGPVIKIDPASLPVKDNIHYLGAKKYDELPSYLAGWDIAVLPFALNESTKYISPTKTPEYLAGGKPVISTSIKDVVTPYGQKGLVHIADTADEFIHAAETIFKGDGRDAWIDNVDDFLEDISWNITWHKMTDLIAETIEGRKVFTANKTITPAFHKFL
jgi:glycosyltransferase involved in cell wall biosynthesis